MTIRKGEPWGAPGALPPDGVVVTSDVEVADLVTAARRDRHDPPVVGLAGGDLCRTLGGRGDRERLGSGEAMTFPIDLGEVLLDGGLHVFAAHLVARRRLWVGRAVVVMNAAWLGDLNLGPKAHPNDGLLDVTEARLRPGELLAVRRRARSGSHLPHPRLTMRRTGAEQVRFERPTPVWLDGRRVGSFREISVRAAPDALTVVV
jgi:hypothetical protein